MKYCLEVCSAADGELRGSSWVRVGRVLGTSYTEVEEGDTLHIDHNTAPESMVEGSNKGW